MTRTSDRPPEPARPWIDPIAPALSFGPFRLQERWCTAELLRIKAGLLLGRDAEAHFLQSLDWARRQQALSWELRTATQLAPTWGEQGRRDDARELLAPVYARFGEGFATADLVAAKRLLDAL